MIIQRQQQKHLLITRHEPARAPVGKVVSVSAGAVVDRILKPTPRVLISKAFFRVQ